LRAIGFAKRLFRATSGGIFGFGRIELRVFVKDLKSSLQISFNPKHRIKVENPFATHSEPLCVSLSAF